MSRRRLLGGNRNKNNQSIREALNNLFQIDLNHFDSIKFKMGKVETNESGDVITNYELKLMPEELQIFDTLVVKTFEGKENRNYIFSRNKSKPVEEVYIQLLTDQLVEIAGKDDSQNGDFSDQDSQDLQEKNFYWSGRTWTNREEDPLMFSGSKEDGFGLTIWLTS